jgi:hypothetical protein
MSASAKTNKGSTKRIDNTGAKHIYIQCQSRSIPRGKTPTQLLAEAYQDQIAYLKATCHDKKMVRNSSPPSRVSPKKTKPMVQRIPSPKIRDNATVWAGRKPTEQRVPSPKNAPLVKVNFREKLMQKNHAMQIIQKRHGNLSERQLEKLRLPSTIKPYMNSKEKLFDNPSKNFTGKYGKPTQYLENLMKSTINSIQNMKPSPPKAPPPGLRAPPPPPPPPPPARRMQQKM